VRITARVDYAVRAMVVLTAAGDAVPIKAETIAASQGIPLYFLLKILADLRVARLVASRRGQAGGYTLARPGNEIAVADVIRAVEGPLADVHGTSPERLTYAGPAAPLREVWMATRAALRDVLEVTTLADIVSGTLPELVTQELTRPGAERRR
jgi:Rrf2 family protein